MVWSALASTTNRTSCLGWTTTQRLLRRSSVCLWSSSVSDAQPPNLAREEILEARKVRKEQKAAAKAKRRALIGRAKAVDHGQEGLVTYKPFGVNGFEARSGLPDRSRPFLVLGVETSCDDTGAAVIRSDGRILGESLASQHEIHQEWGGIVPHLASQAHREKIDIVIQEALHNANLTVNDIDAIGVTVGPGLEVCLRVGCNAARELALTHNKPFVGVHHLEAHILMARLPLDHNKHLPSLPVVTAATANAHEAYRMMDFPFLALLVSGGHCQLLQCLGIGRYSIIGGTIDDSLGEAYDKTARLLGLPVGGGGGPILEKLALEGDPLSIDLPIPLAHRKNCDFSYAGLKTAVRMAAERLCEDRGVESVDDLSRSDKADIAASFQYTAILHVEQKLKRAMDIMEALEDQRIRTLALVGGVAANTELRTRLEKLCSERNEPWTMHVPPPKLCTDQGTMSAWAAVERLMVGSSDDPSNQEVFARFPFSVPPKPVTT